MLDFFFYWFMSKFIQSHAKVHIWTSYYPIGPKNIPTAKATNASIIDGTIFCANFFIARFFFSKMIEIIFLENDWEWNSFFTTTVILMKNRSKTKDSIIRKLKWFEQMSSSPESSNYMGSTVLPKNRKNCNINNCHYWNRI